MQKAGFARWRKLEGYARTLSNLRDDLLKAADYWPIVVHSADLLADWKYVQALISLPSEKVLRSAQSWEPNGVAFESFRRWLCEEISKALKKERDDLFRDSTLPSD